ncbi:MAG: hypothetical protein JNG88_07460 [Phycisphaerales bacterium]|nr:hypothetical protein [Phycisphaerales bacterium]
MPFQKCYRVAAALALCLNAAAQSPTSPQPAATTQPPPYIGVEAEVIANVLNQPIGSHTLADLALPREFIEVIADRVIQSSFQERYRAVVRDPAMTTRPAAAPQPPRTSTQPAESAEFAIKANPLDTQMHERDRWEKAGERRLPLSGFRVCPSGEQLAYPAFEISPRASAAERDAALIIAKSLSREGVVAAAARGVLALGPQNFGEDRDVNLRKLAEVGLPSDLLQFFFASGRIEPINPKWLAERLAENPTIDERFAPAAFEFRFTQSHAGFVVATEDGREGRRSVRIQLTRGDDWIGPGDGSGLDIFRQIVGALRELPIVVHVESRHLGPLLESMNKWGVSNPERLLLLAEGMIVSQWAADNCKSGSAAVAGKSHREFITLAPRYTSRGEDGPVFVPGDTRLLASLTATGRRLACSPLLFQGGNLLAYRPSPDDGVLLLAGEAEIHRNVSLGLTSAQAAEALRVEFGAERIEILPAASFHIDYELSLRAREHDVVAFVNDSHAACAEIIRIGLSALQRGGHLSADDEKQAGEFLRSGQIDALFDLIAPAIGSLAVASGQFAESRIAAFATSEVDSAVGNFQRFLFALDFELAAGESPRERLADGHTQAYFRSLRRMETRRRDLQQRLAALGLKAYPVPSLSADRLSVNYTNAVQTYSHMLIPAYGGLFASLDTNAERLIRGGLLPNVRVRRINCAESQRRGGGLHCSISVE